VVVGEDPWQGLNFASLVDALGINLRQILIVERTTMFPQLARFTDLGVLLLRLMVGLVFVTSGYSALKGPVARAKSIGMSKAFTIFLGAAEAAGGLGVAFGVLTQLAAFGLILIMLGAVGKKIFVWHTGFWGEKASGWHYDLMLILMNLVIAFTNGGAYVLVR
jgi:putative oxidoreductase